MVSINIFSRNGQNKKYVLTIAVNKIISNKRIEDI